MSLILVMFKKNYFLIGICLTTLLGCKKDSPIPINLTFTDYYTNKPISGLKVCLTRNKMLSVFTPPKTIDTLTTDINGKITYTINDPQDYIYFISSAHNTIYCGFEDINLSNSGATNSQTIKLKEFNCLKIFLNDTSKVYQTFDISINEQYTPGGYFNGDCNDTSFIFSKCVPDEYLTINMDLFKGQLHDFTNYINFDTSCYITNVDTFELNIKY